MAEIPAVGAASTTTGRVDPGPDVASRQQGESRSTTAGRTSDRVEVSDVARFLSRLHAVPPVRQELVDSVRSEIEAGTYETPERIEAATEALLKDLDL